MNLTETKRLIKSIVDEKDDGFVNSLSKDEKADWAVLCKFVGCLDENIRLLVLVFDSIPGVDTKSSCGGHVNPQGGQRAITDWYISFRVSDINAIVPFMSLLNKENVKGVNLDFSFDGSVSPIIFLGGTMPLQNIQDTLLSIIGSIV